jgi:hypothetical protein
MRYVHGEGETPAVYPAPLAKIAFLRIAWIPQLPSTTT